MLPRFACVFLTILLMAPFGRVQERASAADSEIAAVKASLAQQALAGDLTLQNGLGNAALSEHRYAEAFKWFKLAAEKGDDGAEVNLAFLYANGLGVDKDFVRAFHWYMLAAAQGNPAGEFNVAFCYMHGTGVTQNRDLTITWAAKAFKDGDGGRSANFTATAYEVAPRSDYVQALRWYKKAAELGYGPAQYSACRLLMQGLGAPMNYPEAINFCLASANSGDPWGQLGMGYIYEDGDAAPRDYKEAARWYGKSAEQANPEAQFKLGLLYAVGKGVERDSIEAYKWLAIAGALKHPKAASALDDLTSHMTDRQVAAAQALAKRWIDDHPRDPEDNEDYVIYTK